MRIGLAHKRLDLKGGTERDLYLTAEGLRDLGHEIHLFCGEFDIEPPAGTIAHAVPIAPFGRSARLWSFAVSAPKVIRRYDCEVVVNFGRMLRQDVLRSGGGPHRVFLEKLGRAGGSSRRLWQSLSPYHRSLLALERRQFCDGHFKRVVAVSELVKREIIAAYAVPEEKITVLHNGVDGERFHPSLRAKWRNAVREEWGVPLDAPLVLFVGSGFRRKGLDRLLAAWESSRLNDVYLMAVGEDASLQTYAARADERAKGRIVFTGRQESVEKFYGAADIVALPSVQEAFGNVVLEGLASGLPVLVTRSVGASEILKGDLRAGVIDKPEDANEVEDRIKTLLKRGRRPESAAESRRVAEDYSWKNHFKKLESCLMQAVR
ncbi:MAG: glycosyltransferase family 4 protein [Candidatus Binatia bacterium]